MSDTVALPSQMVTGTGGKPPNGLFLPVAWMTSKEVDRVAFDEWSISHVAGNEWAKIRPTEYDAALYAQSTIDALQSRIAELEKDVARMDWVQGHLLCADVEYEVEPGDKRPVLIIDLPGGVGVGGNARKLIDAAREASK